MRDFLKNLKLNEQNISMLLGAVVVVLVGSLLYNYFKSVNQPAGDTSSTSTSEQVQVPSGDQLPADYTVQSGDTLWSISERAYGTGYNWMDVYQANKEALGNNPNRLLTDTKINLPKVDPKVVALPATSSDNVDYVVEKGDTLWGIAVKACNDGYQWSAIAKANNLAHPNSIEVGQSLTISCN